MVTQELKITKTLVIALLIVFGIGILPCLSGEATALSSKGSNLIDPKVNSLGKNELMGPRILPSTTTHYLPNGAITNPTAEEPTPPLKKEVSLLSQLNEIFPIGSGEAGTGWETHAMIDDGLHNYKVSTPLKENPVGGTLFSPAVGDFDGDGVDETFLARGCFHDANWIWHTQDAVFVDPQERAKDRLIGWAFPYPGGIPNLYEMKIAAGDFDGDSISELLLVKTLNPTNFADYKNSFIQVAIWDFTRRPTVYQGKSTWILDFEEVATQTFADEKYDYIQTFVAVGDFDGDYIDEFAITTMLNTHHTHLTKLATNEFWHPTIQVILDTHRGWICNYDGAKLTIKKQWDSTEIGIGPKGDQAGYQAPIAAGDFDGDLRDELAVFSLYEFILRDPGLITSTRLMKQSLYLIEDEGQLYRSKVLWQNPEEQPEVVKKVYRDLGRMQGVGAGDLNGDRRDEILLYLSSYVSKDLTQDTIEVWRYQPQKAEYGYLGMVIDGVGTPTFFTSSKGGYIHHPVIADVNFDNKAEIITSDPWVVNIILLKEGPYIAAESWPYTEVESPYRPWHVAIGDFDGDGVTLQYTGEHWESSAPPGIVAALAAPPTFADPQIGQNRGASTSAFSSSTEKSVTRGEAFGASVGATISFSVELEFFFSYEAGITLSKEMTLSKSTTNIETQTRSFSSGYDMNTVIFHLTDYHSFKYTIQAFPGNASMVGQNVTIDLPTGTHLTQWNIVEYNRHYASSPKIGAETFTHTIGEPWTYPNQTIMNKIAPTRWQMANTFLVDNTNSWSGGSLSIAEAETQGGSTVRGIEMYAGVAVAGVGFQGSVGFTEEQAYSVSVGKETEFSCQIGGIPDYGLHQRYAFTFAPVVYFIEHPAGITYPVLNYVVEGANSLPLEGDLIPATSFIPEMTPSASTPPETTTDTTPSGPIPGFEAFPVFLAIPFLLWWRRRRQHK